MAKKNEMTHDDLMQLPNDIAGMVLEVQGRQTQPATPMENEQEELIQEQSTSAPATSKPTPEPTALPKEGNLMWNTFAPLYPPHVGAGFPLHTLPHLEAPTFPQSPLPESALHPSQVSPPSPHSCCIFLQNWWIKNLLQIPYV